MLILKAPLTLTCNPSVISSQKSFYHRIAGNYGVIASGIEREDLLYMVTTPPELYLEESGMTNLIQNTQIQNHQEQKILMINNLLNRIAIMEEAHLTYQDRVYISSMLQKLGIEDIKQFMTKVHRSKQRIETTEQLVALYWNHLGELREMVEAYHSQEKTHQTTTEQIERERLFLHEEILKRLQTGAIYQILYNFYTSQNRHSVAVTNQELRIAEQKQMATQILLYQLKKEVQGEQVPLIYQHENYYETFVLQEGEVTEEKISRQITSAVLLDIMEHLYLSQFERKQYQEQTWISTAHALYQSAENTFYRLRTEWLSQIKKENRQHIWTLWQQQSEQQEIQLIQKLLTDGWEAKERLYTIQKRDSQDSKQLWEYVREYVRVHDAIEETETESEEILSTDKKSEEVANRLRQILATEQEKTAPIQKEKDKSSREEQMSDEKQEKISLEIIEKVIKELPSEDIFSKNKEKKVLEDSSVQMTLQTLIKENHIDSDDFIELYFAWIEEEQKKFYQYMEQYLRISQMSIETAVDIAKEQMQHKEIEGQKKLPASIRYQDTEYREQTAKTTETVLLKWHEQEAEPMLTEEAALKAYQDNENYHPNPLTPEAWTQQIFQEFLTEQQNISNEYRTDVHSSQEHIHQTMLPEENLNSEILSASDKENILKQQLQKINQQNIANYTAYQKLQEAQKSESKHMELTQRDMRKDSLKALQNPELLLQEIQKAHAEDVQQKQKERIQFTQLLPEQTKRFYQRLEQYLNAPEKQKESEGIIKNNTALLLHDIQQIENESTEKEQPKTEDIRQIQETSKEVLEKWEALSVPEISAYDKPNAIPTQPPLTFIHKSVDHQLYEDWLYELLKENQAIKKTIRTAEQEEYHQETTKRTIYQQNQQILEKENTDFTELIQKGVQRQIGAISEQIYNKLEKRLQNEKKRRGY